MSERDAIVAVYSRHIGAEEAVKELRRGGIEMRTLSIIGKDSHTDEHPVGYYNTGDRIFGRFPGAAVRLRILCDSRCRSRTRVGSDSVGLPKDGIVQYELALKTDKFLVIVHGAAPESAKARYIIESTRPLQVVTHTGELARAGAR